MWCVCSSLFAHYSLKYTYSKVPQLGPLDTKMGSPLKPSSNFGSQIPIFN